jgi:DUF1365 family protein
MKKLNSKLCLGTVGHRRYRPCQHTLSYSVFSLLLDLGELDTVDQTSRLLSVNRSGIMSWWERDHGLGNATGLKQDIENMVQQSGQNFQPTSITMLCFPRVLGYVFNPLTVYFCRDESGDLKTMVYEVNNTFGGRHFYIVHAGEAANGTYFHAAKKAFYVSPFNRVEGDYTFRVASGENLITIGVSLKVDGKPLLNAYQSARPEPLTDRALIAALYTMPLMTIKVIAGIHFEALRLWLKGLRITRRPQPPTTPHTIDAHERAFHHD